jgi:HEAT repeat protein
MIREYGTRRDDLWLIPLDRAQNILAAMLDRESRDPQRIARIVESIGRAGAPLHADRVRPFLDHADPAVRRAAVRAIGIVGSTKDTPRIALLVRDPDPLMRRTAVISLGASAQPAMVPLLEQIGRREPELLSKAHEAIQRIRASQEADFRHLLDALLLTGEYEDLLVFVAFSYAELQAVAGDASRDPLVRQRAVRLLYLRRVRSAAPVFKAILSEKAAPRDLLLETIFGCGICVVRSAYFLLLPYLQSSDAAIRLQVIEAIGRIDEPRAFDPLVALWKEEPLRPVLRLALSRLSSVAGSPELIRIIDAGKPPPAETPAVIREDLRMIRQLPIQSIRAELDNTSAPARLDAITLLGLFGDPDVRPLIENAAASDPDPGNRSAAQKVLSRLRNPR